VFLGLIGHYKNFIQNYGVLAKPLTQLLQKKSFIWTQFAHQAMDGLKKAMSSTPVLAIPNFDKQFTIETDACDRGVGVVLSQGGHPIAFFSKTLSANNKKLSAYEKEFLVVMMTVDKWRSYLSRHKSLGHLRDQSLSTKLQRKVMVKLEGLQFTLQYKRGPENKVVDVLSRVGYTFSI
jgi:hypothetical protein